MKLIDLFEQRSQEQVHHNPSVATLKALARNNRYHSARFVITKDHDVIAADSEHFTHYTMWPHMPTWEVRGYVQYMGDGEYAYRSMEVYSALNKDHPMFRIWERAGIQDGNPDQSHLTENKDGNPWTHPFIHRDRNLDVLVQVEQLSPGTHMLMIQEHEHMAAYVLVQEFEGNYWLLEAETLPAYRRQGYNSLLIDSAIKLHGEVFMDMDLTPDSIKAIESYVSRTPYRVRRLNTMTGELHDYNPHYPTDQMQPMYDVHVPGVLRPAHADGQHWAWHLSLDKPRHALLMGYIKQTDVMQRPSHLIRSHVREAWSNKYKKSINCANPRGFSQRAHCAARKARQAHRPTTSKSVYEHVKNVADYDNWIRHTPDSLQSDWNEYVHKSDTKWRKRAHLIGARWPLFTNIQQFKQALDAAPIMNVDELGHVENMSHNPTISDIKSMVSNYQNPRDVDRIVQGLTAHVPLPLPIILKGRKGMWIQAGNTRQAVSRVLNVTPKALLVDVSDQDT